MERDPVTGETLSDDEVRQVDEGTSRYATKFVYNGRWYYFRGLFSRAKFVGGPTAYVSGESKGEQS